MDTSGKIRTGDRIGPFDRPDGAMVRFTMRRGLDNIPSERPLPFGYRLEPWCEPMIPAYAAVLAVAFSDSPDLEYYPRLGSGEGCKEIMEDLVKSPAFLTGGTWLVIFNREPAAVIISSREAGKKDGRVEVVAVAPRHRRVRVGSHLVNKALWALRDRHLIEACLRVNRSNRAAVRFFRSLGFQASESREHI